VTFLDGTEVLLWAEKRWCTYLNKAKLRRTFDLNDVGVCAELAKRIKYVKEILSQLVAKPQ
jgi:hypothetical protein